MAMWVAGTDTQSKRFGLMAKDTLVNTKVVAAAPPASDLPPAAATTQAAPESSAILQASFDLQTPVMLAASAVDLAPAPVPEMQPEIANEAALRILRVNASGLNVREGPGTGYAVVGRLKRGDEVLVVVEPEASGGWALIRIEGDGVEGYVSGRLLAE